MGHGKETPRQKMIGMMYLVLTAMLALNVAKDVLNAFILVDEGLVTTTNNFAAKNDGLYSTFRQQAQLNPAKVGEWKDKADEVQSRSNEMFDFLHECKVDILSIKSADAIDPNSTEINWHEVTQKDNMDHPAQVMMVEGKGKELKDKFDDHREYMLSLIGDKEKYLSTVEAVEVILSTKPPEIDLEHGGKKVVPTWESTYFEHLPMAAVIALLSEMQAGIRNAEAEMLEFLLGQIVAGEVSFNTIDAVVMADNSLVFPGQEYKAKVFLAAYDSTKAPDVVLEDDTKLEVEGGKGIYTAVSNSLGIKTWGGTITLENADGSLTSRPFKSSYEVAEANATISATAMNVFYRGLNNPVAISAGGVAESAVRVGITSPHSIKRRKPGVYNVKPGVKGDKAVVSVYAEIDGSRKLMTRMNFRVKDLPTPTAKIKGSRGGKAALTVGQLTGLQIVEAEAEDFLFEVEFQVTSFTIGFNDASGIWVERKSGSKKFTSEQKGIFRSMRAGQRISIENIKAIGPDGKVRSLSPINITVR
ncbi:MAG: gliding motility protein GldM [Bacteroidota bacterium]